MADGEANAPIEIEQTVRTLIESMDEAAGKNIAELERVLAQLNTLRQSEPAWKAREKLIRSAGALSPERREELLRLAAEVPGLDDALNKGDAWWQAVRTGELPGAGSTGGHPHPEQF